MKLRTVLEIAVAGAVLLGGCGGQTSSQTMTHVPPGSQIFSHVLPADVGVSTDDIPVTRQWPAAGAATKRHAVVIIITPCTRRHPCS